MNDHADSRILPADRIHMFGQKSLVHRAVAFPEDDARGTQSLRRDTPVAHVRIPYGHLVQRNSYVAGSVAAEVLVGQEKDFGSLGKCPLKCACAIGGGTDQAAALTTKCFNGGSAIPVGGRRKARAS